ncbi:MAG: hypothetical protein LW850_34355 [Planctomycetaceae bacterium]|nr:hypothetical protein [Planctomycetaceae bacterium]
MSAPLHAAVVLKYPFSNSGDGQNGFAPSAFDSSVLASQAVTKGPGLLKFAVETESVLSTQVLKTGPGTSVSNATAADALSNDWYFSIALTPHSTMDISSIEMDWSRGGTVGTRGWFVRSSQDNYTTDLYSNETLNGTAVGLQHVSISLSGFSGIGATDFRDLWPWLPRRGLSRATQSQGLAILDRCRLETFNTTGMHFAARCLFGSISAMICCS